MPDAGILAGINRGRLSWSCVRNRDSGAVRQFCLIAAVLLLGALVLSPVVAALGLDPMPGDIMFRWDNTPVVIPVIYSLCASVGLALFYKIMKR